MLYHHDQLPYAVKLAQCAARTREKFAQILQQGQQQLPAALEHLQTVPDDVIVQGDRLDVAFLENNVPKLMVGERDDLEWTIHDNAWSQICAKTGFPSSYAEKLRDTDWGRELVSLNLNTIFANQEKKRYLIRSVKGEARGFLSDRYRRLDMRPIMDNLFGVARELGAVVIQAVASDTKGEIKFAFPTILEPIKDEPILYWVGARASDYGESKVQISGGWTRAICTNFATGDSYFSQVHLGKQLPDNIEFSVETYRKDTEFVVSATRDVFRDAFNPKKIELLCERLRLADSKDAPKDIPGALRRAGLTKAETEAASLIYDQPEIEILPKGDTMWRFANVISFMAHGATPDRKLELEAIAGEFIPKQMPKQLAAAQDVA